MKLYTIRLHPNDDLRQSLQTFAAENDIQAGFIITCAGALKVAVLRVAGATPNKETVNKHEENFEIISLTGTLTCEDCHLHIGISREDGSVIGGHLKNGSIVDVTAEVVIGEDENSSYSRVRDDETGYEELAIQAR